ncbi:phosphonate transport system permease protein [Anaerosolibacter carboniphilus]|uniref:Phosphonate transport system permease protein n=1 Tax=Anaerosolibacter carboniphilus TaxID=1417629 RepID=A0A841KZG4_9FIRM|nr:ABC transporter permease subunit [Anaerosolibacter carboniphilus]MBB6216302.1 phosphonate transport system permease protein [Anaerosolibacter carboniphilus]
MQRWKNSLQFHKRTMLTVLLVLVFIWSLFSVPWGAEVLHPGGKATIIQIFTAFLHPNFSPEILGLAFISSWRTMAYAAAGMSLAIIIAFVFGILASGVLCSNPFPRLLSKSVFRSLLGFMRAIHELIWAWLFVAALGLSPFAAIFALAIPYGGTLGRIFADILNDAPEEPIKALKASGASRLQLLCYGYLPMTKVDMISYVMYRFECAIRSSTIMSFVGLGGLGYQIQLALADLDYSKVWTYMFFLIGLVLLVDGWSNLLRKRLLA